MDHCMLSPLSSARVSMLSSVSEKSSVSIWLGYRVPTPPTSGSPSGHGSEVLRSGAHHSVNSTRIPCMMLRRRSLDEFESGVSGGSSWRFPNWCPAHALHTPTDSPEHPWPAHQMQIIPRGCARPSLRNEFGDPGDRREWTLDHKVDHPVDIVVNRALRILLGFSRPRRHCGFSFCLHFTCLLLHLAFSIFINCDKSRERSVFPLIVFLLATLSAATTTH